MREPPTATHQDAATACCNTQNQTTNPCLDNEGLAKTEKSLIPATAPAAEASRSMPAAPANKGTAPLLLKLAKIRLQHTDAPSLRKQTVRTSLTQ